MKLDRSLGLVFTALVGAIGCARYSTWRDVPVDCTVEAQYQLDPTVPNTFAFEMVGASAGWASADGSPGSVMTFEVKTIPEGPRCGSAAALVLTAEKNNDWGSLFGLIPFGKRDESAFEGMSFWARAGYESNTGFTILLDDPNTSNPDAPAVCSADAGAPPPPPDGGYKSCKNYCNDGGTGTGTTDPGTGMIIPGTVSAAPEPDQCGNGYATVLTVASDWRFYTIPFSKFFQSSTPNRVPNPALMMKGPIPDNGLRTSELLNLIFRMPKAVRTELWIDNLSFYRKATAPSM